MGGGGRSRHARVIKICLDSLHNRCAHVASIHRPIEKKGWRYLFKKLKPFLNFNLTINLFFFFFRFLFDEVEFFCFIFVDDLWR